jgi:hypothetical protein
MAMVGAAAVAATVAENFDVNWNLERYVPTVNARFRSLQLLRHTVFGLKCPRLVRLTEVQCSQRLVAALGVPTVLRTRGPGDLCLPCPLRPTQGAYFALRRPSRGCSSLRQLSSVRPSYF